MTAADDGGGKDLERVMETMTKIAEAVEPLRTAAMDRAEQFAREYVTRLLAELESVGGDAELCAPYPKGTMGRVAYVTAQQKYQMVRRLTRPLNREVCRRMSDPDVRTADPASIEKFVQEARKDADAQYTAFIAKLEDKIGPHTDAVLTGDHVWGYSILTVETPAGRQNWKTQQILNVSKLGKVFNQWPTRKARVVQSNA